MTTPNQPNDGHQTNGVTERIAPSPIPPRPIPRPGAGETGQPGGGQQGGQPQQNVGQQGDFGPKQGAPNQGAPKGAPESGGGQEGFDQETVRMGSPGESGGPDGAKSAPGGGQSQYKDGWSQLPQREPQSNLYRPGQAPVAGRPPADGGGGLGAGSGGAGNVGLNGGVTNARTTADLAAKAARKEAAMVKSVGIDGPTRSIARPELIKDMPDLSEIRHPLPHPEPVGMSPQAHISPAAPVAVAAAVASGEPLRATVQIRRIDPWSTLKISLVISVALFFVWMLAVGLLYIVLEGMGVWERLNNTFTDMVSQDSGSVGLIDAGTVFGYAGVIGLINVVLFTALGTVGTFIYNQCCDLVGGIQVTLADPD
ncbi:Transmembrane protein of unknown function [Nocardia amikacinitolerans]|uniref:DUF3566 domain-containing protein n=1 Tax=Nocardia amikacinitolerans TaxID=756689 RepID=A0A285LQZ9_9NOCA|nr:DUF3566 domain-containing protein [Nocardia amikacinitolerans]SNY87315.1 Transmembrane protein of unknown function [Nocardia amikacinitolerans]